MQATCSSLILQGLSAIKIEVEVATQSGIPKIIITGLADRVISEARERILSTLKTNQIQIKSCRTVINLFPSDVPKKDSHLELAILVGLLKSYQHPGFADFTKQDCFIGALGLDGSVKPVKKILALVICAQELGFKRVFVPAACLEQLKSINGLKIVAVENIAQLADCRRHTHYTNGAEFTLRPQLPEVSINELIVGDHIKRVLQLAAAGRHHLLLSGPPGMGKTLIAQALLSLFPSLSYQKTLEVSKIHSAVENCRTLTNSPPFRAPHHRITPTKLMGGGLNLQPGEMTLAHNGILFLDEINLFSTQALDCLREPLEKGSISLNSQGSQVSYPANFVLVAAQNPCPCGYYGSQQKVCRCTPWQRQLYQQKLSGAILDRIDLFLPIELDQDGFQLLKEPNHQSDNKKLETLQLSINSVRDIQRQRLQQLNLADNSSLTGKQTQQMIYLNKECKALLTRAGNNLHLSHRSLLKTIRVARTIADLEQTELVSVSHITEALGYRQRGE